MNLVFAQVIEVLPGDELREGKVRVGGAIKTVSLGLLPEVRSGDEVLLCDGMAISRVDGNNKQEKIYVPGNSRQA